MVIPRVRFRVGRSQIVYRTLPFIKIYKKDGLIITFRWELDHELDQVIDYHNPSLEIHLRRTAACDKYKSSKIKNDMSTTTTPINHATAQ